MPGVRADSIRIPHMRTGVTTKQVDELQLKEKFKELFDLFFVIEDPFDWDILIEEFSGISYSANTAANTIRAYSSTWNPITDLETNSIVYLNEA